MRPQSGSEAKTLLDHERAELPFLVYRDDEDALRIQVLTDEPTVLTLGRDPTCNVALTWDGSASRTHAILERIGRAWTILDDGISTNGTFVNAVRVTTRRRLADRDTLSLGATVLEFRSPREGSGGKTQLEQPVIATPVTPMQRKVLLALCRPLLTGSGGFGAPASNAEIAAELVLSTDAIKTHMRALFERFGVGDLAQNQKRARVAELAIRSGLVSERDLEPN